MVYATSQGKNSILAWLNTKEFEVINTKVMPSVALVLTLINWTESQCRKSNFEIKLALFVTKLIFKSYIIGKIILLAFQYIYRTEFWIFLEEVLTSSIQLVQFWVKRKLYEFGRFQFYLWSLLLCFKSINVSFMSSFNVDYWSSHLNVF